MSDAQRQAPGPGGRALRRRRGRRGLLDRPAALATIDAAGLDALLHPTFDRDAGFEVIASGVGASPGRGQGEIVLTARAAIDAAAEGR